MDPNLDTMTTATAAAPSASIDTLGAAAATDTTAATAPAEAAPAADPAPAATDPAPAAPAGQTTITLGWPFDFNGATISEVTVRRPKVKDARAIEAMRASDKSDIDEGAQTVAILSGLDPAAVDEMDASDFEKVSAAIQSFFQ